MSSLSYASDHYVVLDAAEKFFTKMNSKKYSYLWKNITEKSQKRIVNDLFDALKSEDGDYSKEKIKSDMEICGDICVSYWEGYLENFDPDSVLEDSEWSIGKFSRDKLTINLLHKKSDRPAFLYMYNINGKWKVGLVESFWLRMRFK